MIELFQAGNASVSRSTPCFIAVTAAGEFPKSLFTIATLFPIGIMGLRKNVEKNQFLKNFSPFDKLSVNICVICGKKLGR